MSVEAEITVGVSVDETVKRLPELMQKVDRLTEIAKLVKPEQAEQIEHEIALIVDDIIENGVK